MKRLLLFYAFIFTFVVVWAHDVEIDGIYYNLDNTNKTAEVTYKGWSFSSYKERYSDSVIIPESITYNTEIYSVTSIDYRAFYGCSGLTSISIPNGVTSIGSGAFYGCSGLTSVNIPNSVTSIGISAFTNCTGLTEIIVLSNNKNFTSDNGVLFNKDKTTLIRHPEGKKSTDYSIPNSVTTIDVDAFYGCSTLTTVTIPNSVTSIGSCAFYGCSGLTSVTIPNSVTSIDYNAFDGCKALTKVNYLGTVDEWVEIDFDSYASNPTYYAVNLYINNELLHNVKITSADSIKQYAFYWCNRIYSIEIGNSITYIDDDVFVGCNNLEEIKVASDNKNFSSDNGVLFNKNKTTLIRHPEGKKSTNYSIPNSVTSIGSNAFFDCSDLTSVTIPNSVTSIGSRAFYDCSGLTSISIPNGVTSIDYMAFDGCSGLTSVTIPNSVTSIGSRVFYDCSGLTSITIPNSVTLIGDNAFYGCEALTKVNYLGTVDKWVGIDFNYSNPTYYAKDLYINNKLLTDIKITSADSIKQYAFYNCQSIKSVEIGNSVTSIGNSAFTGCSGLTSVTIPNSVTNIGSTAFSWCSGLTSITIPNSVTSISYGMFGDCSELTSVTIGDGVERINSYAFSGCEKLVKITALPTSVPKVYQNSFTHYNAELYVPCDVYDEYYNNEIFGSFKEIKCIEAEEVEGSDKVEIEVDENNNATIVWPFVDSASSYELVISKDGVVFCTLIFNEKGQLTSIDFSNRSASVGFQFTVTGLEEASKYDYVIEAKDKVGNVLKSYKGTFTTNGYNSYTAILETLADANITVSGGMISADKEFSIYNTLGKDVTALNGSLLPGIYVITLDEDRVKVMVK